MLNLVKTAFPIFAAALLLHPHLCGGQSSKACPVDLRRAQWEPYLSHPPMAPVSVHPDSVLRLKYRNNDTSEVIRSVSFRTVWHFGEEKGYHLDDSDRELRITTALAPRSTSTGYIDFGPSQPGRATVQVAEVEFASGRTWSNTDPFACSLPISRPSSASSVRFNEPH